MGQIAGEEPGNEVSLSYISALIGCCIATNCSY